MLAVVLAALLASNGSGKTLVRQQQGATVTAPTASGPLIIEDANTVAHVVWNGYALVDLHANAWSMNGTVPQVAKSGKTPAGSGAFSDANNYSLGTGVDVGDFASDFAACVVFDGSDQTANHVLLCDGLASTDGWYVNNGATPVMRFSLNNGATVGQISTANQVINGGINVFCFGVAGGEQIAKLNLGTAVTNTPGGVRTPATTRPARIGRYDSTTLAYGGRIYEVWFSTTTPTDALFTAIQQRVKLRAGITDW